MLSKLVEKPPKDERIPLSRNRNKINLGKNSINYNKCQIHNAAWALIINDSSHKPQSNENYTAP